MIYSIDIKPLSVNEAYTPIIKTKYAKGKLIRYPAIISSAKAGKFFRNVSLQLENEIDLYERMMIFIKVYYTSRGSDIDNCIKAFIDSLQHKHQFNDNRIDLLYIKKEVGKKQGFDFEILEFNEDYNEVGDVINNKIKEMW